MVGSRQYSTKYSPVNYAVLISYSPPLSAKEHCLHFHIFPFPILPKNTYPAKTNTYSKAANAG